MTNGPMYQIFVSNDGGLEPGPKFRLLIDAVRFVEKQGKDKSFAIRDPDGSWYCDAVGRSIFGRRGERTARAASVVASATVDASPRPLLARGTDRVHVMFSDVDPEEITRVIRPPRKRR